MKLDFPSLRTRLATTHGGFTLWIGAGASIAATKGTTPGWEALVARIAASGGAPVPGGDSMPTRLEELAETIGHWKLRRQLRELVVDPLTADAVDLDVLTSQALIGARASTLVSFNIEELSALPFCAFSGKGHGVIRTFRERSDLGFSPEMTPGRVGRPIYFPHGTLMLGNLVITQSEYDKFHVSAAMETAVHLCMGSDLVILGMSLTDDYLRKALLRHRRWIRDIYWVDSQFGYREWAHVADVTMVEIDHGPLWSGLGTAIVEHDTSGFFQSAVDDARRDMRGEMEKAIAVYDKFKRKLASHAEELVREPRFSAEQLDGFARLCLESGLDVPEPLRRDSRCTLRSA